MVDRGRDSSKVKEPWFFDCEDGEVLLQWFRNSHSTWNDSEPDGRLSTVLNLIDDKYRRRERDGKHFQEEWRKDRIGLYDTLLLIVLGAENRNWEGWRGGKSTVLYQWNKEFEDNFTKPGSIYKHLLDYIHEHDDVKSEVFSPEFKEKYFCFFGSMERYWMKRSKKLWLFDTEKGKLLLQCLFESPHSRTWTASEPDGRFRDVLKLIDDEYIVDMDGNMQADPKRMALERKRMALERKRMALERKRIRQEWRGARINLYNNLFLIILKDKWAALRVVGSTEGDKRRGEFEAEFTKEGSIYKHLLDYIHEHDDVMLKFYDAKRTNKLHRGALESNDMYYWFFQSMEMYRKRHINLVQTIMGEWIEENKTDWAETRLEDFPEKKCKYKEVTTVLKAATADFNCKVRKAKKEFSTERTKSAIKKFNTEVLEAARHEFNTMIDKSGIKSWRYKARMYWLLSRFQHASKGAFKTLEYVGPVGVLLRKMIKEDNRMLLDEDVNVKYDVDSKFKGFAVKYRYGTKRGTLDYSSMLAYACAKNDCGLVSCMLESKKEFEDHALCDFRWEEAWKETWAKALWRAAYSGCGPIVKELLVKEEWRKLYSTKYYVKMKLTQPLHVAVRRGHDSVVEAFCDSNVKFDCHVEDELSSGYTPLELATLDLKDRPILKKWIQRILLSTSAVSQGVQDLQAQRELTVGSANTIVVGAALIAGVTYAGWLQPPLDYQPYNQGRLDPEAQDAALSYMFVQGHTTIRVFAISNAVSFFFAIAAIVAGMETTCFIGELEQMYMTKKNLHNKLKRTRRFFILSMLSVLIAFSSAAIAVLPPIQRYHTDMYVTIGVGGFFCMAMMFLFTLSKQISTDFVSRTFKSVRKKSRNIKLQYEECG